mmetsp:Transcript_77867/g.126320  ORF Transcript_77867/g.126320 Transcript_77867/m.126320 type:complete len:201 (+) Transcript_77867:156-758(+)
MMQGSREMRIILFALLLSAARDTDCFSTAVWPERRQARAAQEPSCSRIRASASIVNVRAQLDRTLTHRRRAVAVLAATPLLWWAGTTAVSAQGDESVAINFAGDYTDPRHPGCPRTIAPPDADNIVQITGKDGTSGPGCSGGAKGFPRITRAWQLSGTVKDGQIFVDFSKKGGPKDMVGKWEQQDGSIRWPDRNRWTKVR